MVSNFNKKQKRRGFSKRNFYFVAGGILFLTASAFLIFADIKIYKEKQKLNDQLLSYKKQIEEIENRNKVLKEGIVESDNNDYIEKIAREELDLQKQGEKVVTFIMPPAQQQTQKTEQQNFFNIKTWTGWLSQSWSWIKGKF